MIKVYVAGATGAIGKQLVPRLVEAGHEVHGMARSESKQAILHELGAEQVELVRKRKFPLLGDGGGVWSFIHTTSASSRAMSRVTPLSSLGLGSTRLRVRARQPDPSGWWQPRENRF